MCILVALNMLGMIRVAAEHLVVALRFLSQLKSLCKLLMFFLCQHSPLRISCANCSSFPCRSNLNTLRYRVIERVVYGIFRVAEASKMSGFSCKPGAEMSGILYTILCALGDAVQRPQNGISASMLSRTGGRRRRGGSPWT